MNVVPLREAHLEDAAHLFALRYQMERRDVPELPARHEDERGVLPMLANLLGRAPGVAAVEGDSLVGYLIGMPIPRFAGPQRGAFSPIWAHCAIPESATEVYLRMYERISREWVDAGCLTHAITVYARDSAATDVFFRNCFGLLVVDAIRSLAPTTDAPPSGITVRPATVDDVDSILPLAEGLGRHLAGGPVLLPMLVKPTRAKYASFLAEPAHGIWIALRDGQAISYLRTQPPTEDVTYVVSDPGTISISGAYTRPEWRGMGVGAALLARVVDWATASGYARCSVDFEAQNISGSRFWLRHFRPICHSLIRRVDERIAWARGDRPAETIW